VKEKNKIVLFTTIIYLMFLLLSTKGFALTINCNQSLNEVENAYNYLYKASSLGYSSPYLNELKESVNYLNLGINTGNQSYCVESYNISKNLSIIGPKILSNAKINYDKKVIENILLIVIPLILSYLSYRYLPSIFWNLWLKTHGDYEVEVND
jgi:hypothetical protein